MTTEARTATTETKAISAPPATITPPAPTEPVVAKEPTLEPKKVESIPEKLAEKVVEPVKAEESKEPTLEPKKVESAAPIYEVKLDENGDLIEVAGLELPPDEKLSISKEHLIRLTTFAREQRLPKETAQMLLNRENQIFLDHEKAQEAMLAERRAAWEKASKEDAEIGGVHYDETQELFNRTVDEYAPPALKKMLEETGLGKHPLLRQFVTRFAKRHIANDTFINGDTRPLGRELSEEERFARGMKAVS